MLEKIECLQKQLSEIYPRETQVQTEVHNNVPDLEDVSKKFYMLTHKLVLGSTDGRRSKKYSRRGAISS